MIFQQFYLQSLGHASYLVGSEQTGEALVLDVRRDVDVYFAAARQHGMRIRYAADTHQHNDYLTGICELPARTEVELLAGPVPSSAIQYATYSLSHMTLHFLYDLIVLLFHSSGSSISSCQYRSSSSRIAAIAAWHVAGVTLANPSSRWPRSPAIV